MKRVLLLCSLLFSLFLQAQQNNSTMAVRGTINTFGETAMTYRSNFDTWIVTIQAPASNASAGFLFSPVGASFNPKWAFGAGVTINAKTSWFHNGNDGIYNQTNGRFYTFICRDVAAPASSEGYLFETDAAPVSVSSVTQSPLANTLIGQNTSVTVTATTSANLPNGQGVFLRYTTDNFASSTVVNMTGSGTSYSATIPAQPGDVTVQYYVFTSGGTTPPSAADADLATINLNNNAGANYIYGVTNITGVPKTINGNYSDWSASEIIASVAGEPVSMSWDDTYLYFRFLNGFGDADQLQVAIDVNPGTIETGITTEFARSSFSGYLTPEYLIRSTGIANLDLFTRSGTSWGGLTNIYGGGANLFRSGGNLEFRVLRSSVGLSSNSIPFGVYIWYSQSSGNVYRVYGTGNYVGSATGTAQRARTGIYFNNSANGLVVAENEFEDINCSETGYSIPTNPSNFRNLYVSANDATTPTGFMVATGNITIHSSATLTSNAAGDIRLGGNWYNEGSFNPNGRTVTFLSNNNQTITTFGTGSGKSFNNVSLAGFRTWQLSGYDMRVNGVLSFGSGGYLDLNGNNLVLGPSSSCTGTFNGYIITSNGTNTGFVTRTLGSGASFTFPVGTSTHYLPVTLQDAATSSHDFAVRAYTPPTSDGVPGSGNNFFSNELDEMVQAIWNIDRSSGTGNVNVTLSWPAALEGATFSGYANGNIGISRRGAGGWLNGIQNTADNSTNTATATFSSFSPFGVGKLGAPLPVKFTGISGQLEGDRARITWTVAEEFNVERYELEESADGISFRTLLTVSAGTGTRYQGMDPLLVSGNNYYRVKAVDIDGKLTYSRIIRLVKGGGTPGIQLSPVPAREQVNLLMTSLRAGTWNLTIVNAAGQVVLRQSLAHDGSNRNQPLALPAGLSRGLYWLQLGNGQESYRQSLLVE